MARRLTPRETAIVQSSVNPPVTRNGRTTSSSAVQQPASEKVVEGISRRSMLPCDLAIDGWESPDYLESLLKAFAESSVSGPVEWLGLERGKDDLIYEFHKADVGTGVDVLLQGFAYPGVISDYVLNETGLQECAEDQELQDTPVHYRLFQVSHGGIDDEGVFYSVNQLRRAMSERDVDVELVKRKEPLGLDHRAHDHMGKMAPGSLVGWIEPVKVTLATCGAGIRCSEMSGGLP